MPGRVPSGVAIGCGSLHRQGSDVRKHSKGEPVALRSLSRNEGVRGSNPLSSTIVSACQDTH
jgi:hypothetical protein